MPTLPTPITPYYGGGQVQNPANVIPTSGAPSTKLTEDKVGTIAVDNAAAASYMLVSKAGGVDTWAQVGAGTNFFDALDPDSGGTVFPSAGVIRVVGNQNQLASAKGGGNTLAFALSNGISIGAYQATTPPVGGMLIPGATSIGSSSPDPKAFFNVTNPGTYLWSTHTTGTITTPSAIAHFDNTVCSPISSGGALVSYDSNMRAYVPTGITAGVAALFYGTMFVDQNVGTITNAYAFIANPFFGPLGGTLTNAYGGYFSSPGVGTNQIPLYADGLTIGTPGTAPPTSGMIVAGKVGVGTTTVAATAAMQVSSTTQGFLPPSMTTTQKLAIVSPAAGLVVYDNTLNNLSYYDGTVWVNLS